MIDNRTEGDANRIAEEGGFEFTVEPAEEGSRLDSYLAARLPGRSRVQIQRAIECDLISVNDRNTKASYRIHAGDRVEGDLLPTAPLAARAEAIPLAILYEDDQIVVINKPAGMVVHPGAGISSGTLANALVHHLNVGGNVSGSGDPSRPGIVHRLDQGTSGLLVAAKNESAQLYLSRQFADRNVEKKYLALVYGRLATDQGRIEAPIGRDTRNRTRMAVRENGGGRYALTLYRVQRRKKDFTLLDVEIKTGRTHQIRVHLAHMGHPVVGDSTYDNGRGKSLKDPRMRAAIAALGRPFLHAAYLAFLHPATGQRMEFFADMPDELQNFLAGLSD